MTSRRFTSPLVQVEAKPCEACGANKTKREFVLDEFEYGADTPVRLAAHYPVYSCEECSFSFTDREAEIAKHEAVCRHLKRLTPAEIVAIRHTYQLSQEQFAAITRLGKATIARWETGVLIQSEANDMYLRLIANRENFEHLRGLNAGVGSGLPPDTAIRRNPKFQVISPDDPIFQAATAWQLRRLAS